MCQINDKTMKFLGEIRLNMLSHNVKIAYLLGNKRTDLSLCNIHKNSAIKGKLISYE